MQFYKNFALIPSMKTMHEMKSYEVDTKEHF